MDNTEYVGEVNTIRQNGILMVFADQIFRKKKTFFEKYSAMTETKVG